MSFINYFAEGLEEAREERKKAEEERKKAEERVKKNEEGLKKVQQLYLKMKNGEITSDEYYLELDKMGL